MVQPIPPGYSAVSPYLMVTGAERLLDFVKQVLDAREVDLSRHADGKIWHACVRIGDSTLMMSEANEQYPALPAALHVYVRDVDAVYRRALAWGAESLMEPATHFYGDRCGGVKDPMGNTWWLATHVEDVSPEELARRKQELAQRQAVG